MKKISFLLMVLFFLVFGVQSALAQVYEFQVSLNEQTYLDMLPVSPFITILPDRGNLATYFIGDPISLAYEALKTGYVSILDYTEDERVRILKNNEPVSPGTKKRIQGIVTEPEGMERFLILLSPRIIPDRILVEAMNNPSRMREIVGENVYLNRCTIQIVEKRKEESGAIRFHPVPESILSGRNLRIRMVMTDKNNNPLVNRRVQWYTSHGSLDSYQTYTNTAGESDIWFMAPFVSEETQVQIQATYEGDTAYSPMEGTVTVVVQPEKKSSILVLSPKDFLVVSGENMSFQARLTDNDGNPLPGQTLIWSSNVGQWEKRMTTTGFDGTSTNLWVAPSSVVKTPVELKVNFRGAINYAKSEDNSIGSVEGIEIVSGRGTYFIDFSSGKPETNFEESIYRGENISGFTQNSAAVLAMSSGEYLNVNFQVPEGWSNAACFIWGKSSGSTIIHVHLNENKIFSGNIVGGQISPFEFQSFHLDQFLIPGENQLRIEVQSPDESAFFAIQRLLLVF
ncbi:MAG TPA: hypothetical protein DCY12_02820 [Candidatus Atribacteria bacterium]|nr:hypothetical protein [Candidatus Atribacteria bacterium]